MTPPRGATRRDVLGLAGIGVGTALSASPLVVGALDPPDRPPRPVPGDTLRIGRRWEGIPVTVRIEGRYELAADVTPGFPDAEWTRARLARTDADDPRDLLVRKGTCIEVEGKAGPLATVEGVVVGPRDLAMRVRVQVPTGGTGPPPRSGDPPGGPTSIRTHERRSPPDSPPGGLLGVFRQVDASDQLSFGAMLRELAVRFEGTIPAVAGEGVFGPFPRDEPFPVDEDYACTPAAQD